MGALIGGDRSAFRELEDKRKEKKEEVCTAARNFLEKEFEKFLYGRRDRGHTFEPYVAEQWNRGVYEVMVKMNHIPQDEYIEMMKKRWQRWIGRSMKMPPELKVVFPEVYPAEEWDKWNRVTSEEVAHVSTTV